jgi:hypothetical protein
MLSIFGCRENGISLKPKQINMKLRSCLTLFVLTFLFSTSILAQKGKAVLHAGVNFTRVSITNGGDYDASDILTTFQFGIKGDYHLASCFYIQPGLSYSGKGSKVSDGEPDDNTTWYEATSNPFYIELPLNIVMKSPGKVNFFLGAGPYAAVGVGGKNKAEGYVAGVYFKTQSEIKFSDEDPGGTTYQAGAGFPTMKRLDYGFNMIGGFEFHRIVFTGGYQYGLARLRANNDDNDKNKTRLLSFTLGLKL